MWKKIEWRALGMPVAVVVVDVDRQRVFRERAFPQLGHLCGSVCRTASMSFSASSKSWELSMSTTISAVAPTP
jgi:hypothetical protein